MTNDAYEQDREDIAVNERWAEDHGYSRGRCAVHGTFWTDSGDGCPSCELPVDLFRCEKHGRRACEQCDEEVGDLDNPYSMQDPQEPDVKLELMVQSWEHRLLRAARETTQGNFLMSAMHRNGVFHD